MHLSDGFLNTSTALCTSAAAATSLGVGVWQLRRRADALPSAGRMALVGAAVFAAQAINFPLAGGVSGHLLGGVAAAALLGPWAGMIVISAVLAVQCFLLGDGGVTALGANVLNMAVLGAMLGYPVWRMTQSGASPARRIAVAAAAGFAALPLGALACAVEMHAAGTASFAATAGQMTPLHLLLGVAEGLFTAAAVLAATRERATATAERRNGLAMLAVLAMTAVLVPYSSSLPDTLEAAVERAGVATGEPLLAPSLSESAFAATGSWAASLPILIGAMLAIAAIVLFRQGLSRRSMQTHATSPRD